MNFDDTKWILQFFETYEGREVERYDGFSSRPEAEYAMLRDIHLYMRSNYSLVITHHNGAVVAMLKAGERTLTWHINTAEALRNSQSVEGGKSHDE